MNYIKLILGLSICWFLSINSVKAEAIAEVSLTDRVLQLGIVQLQAGNLEKAREMFGEVINVFPEVQVKQKLRVDSLSDRVKSVQSAYLNRGLAAYRLGDYSAALIDLQTANSIYPWQVEGHYNMGLVWSGQREYDKAIVEYNKALSQVSSQDKSKIANIYNDRGLAYLSLHNYTAAINDFNIGIRHQGNNSWLHYNMGCACHRRGDYAQAINSFSQALSVDPHQSEAYINRGLIYYHLGRVQLALADLNAGANSFYSQGQIAQFKTATELIKQVHGKLNNLPNLAA